MATEEMLQFNLVPSASLKLLLYIFITNLNLFPNKWVFLVFFQADKDIEFLVVGFNLIKFSLIC